MRHALALILAFAVSTACSRVESAQQEEPALELTGRVVDAADLLPPEAERRLTEKLEKAEAAHGPQLVVVTTPSLKGQDIAIYSLDLARAWGVGHKERNDGLLLLVAPNERKARIEVGYGLEASFSDEFAGQVLREDILPRFSERSFEAGIEAGVDRLIDKMKAVPTKPANDNPAPLSKDDAA